MRTNKQIQILIKSCGFTLEGLWINKIISQEEFKQFKKNEVKNE